MNETKYFGIMIIVCIGLCMFHFYELLIISVHYIMNIKLYL